METNTTKTSLVRVTEIQGRGRGLVATRPIEAGQCQSGAQTSSHTEWVCKSLNILSSSSLDPETHTQACFLIAAYNLAIVSTAKFQLLLLLQGNGATVDSQAHLLHSFMVSVMSFWPLQGQLPGFSPELTASLLSKDKQNAFGLMAPVQQGGERQVRAYAIYAQASFFNHDCLPNACRFDYVDKPGDHNTNIIIRSLHDIQDGSEICLSYFPVNWPYAERQKRLLEDYGFSCMCDRCRVEETWSDKESMDEENAILEDEMEDEDIELQEADAMGENTGEGESDFPHAYFFVKYLCPVENCGGTMAPLPPCDGTPSPVMECNMCGHLRTDEDFNQDLKDHGMAD
ncbi:hypothetical protein SUGI_0935530 [Cryptomeria japonica]|nr:hypothetical protein SUGI_0935530 [Cryptomeria japonica]